MRQSEPDKSLTYRLKYRVPGVVRERLMALFGFATRSIPALLAVKDSLSLARLPLD